jgi:ParB-like chromosome segregation protein Spo0J
MRETRNENRVSRIAIDKLVAHPDNPNRMSKTNFAKLVRNIERTGRYEPLVVRPCPTPAEIQMMTEYRVFK